jgi:hypothetical protein
MSSQDRRQAASFDERVPEPEPEPEPHYEPEPASDYQQRPPSPRRDQVSVGDNLNFIFILFFPALSGGKPMRRTLDEL